MGIYTRLNALVPDQSCVLCAQSAKRCVCHECESSFTNHQPRCRSCAHSLTGGLDFCGQCLAQAPAFNRADTLYDYQGAIADLIKAFKFDQQLCIGDFFAHKMYDKYLDIVNKRGAYDAIIPLPLSRQRLRERGYNQVHELLRMIAKQTDVFIDQTSTQRIKATRALSGLNLIDRKQEIKGAFSAKPMSYKKVLLVDDVMTTGSSMDEFSKIVLKAGVGSCDVLTLARA